MMNNVQAMTYEQINSLIDRLYNYVTAGEAAVLNVTEQELFDAKELEESVKSYSDYDSKDGFDQLSHTPARLAIFALNNAGERLFNNTIVSIDCDELYIKGTTHTNSYRLKLKDAETHEKLLPGNPTKDDMPYDFDGEFVSQITNYADSGRAVDTTAAPWDSINKCYAAPVRTFDFKSYLWSSAKHRHDVDYAIQLLPDGKVYIFDRFNRKKTAKITELAPNASYLDKYKELCVKVEKLRNPKYSWGYFIEKVVKIDDSQIDGEVCPLDLVELGEDGRCPICGMTPDEAKEA